MIANNKKLQFDLIHYLSSFLLLFFLRTPNNLQHYYNHLFLLQLEARPRPCSLLEFLLNFYHLQTVKQIEVWLQSSFSFTTRSYTSILFNTRVPFYLLLSYGLWNRSRYDYNHLFLLAKRRESSTSATSQVPFYLLFAYGPWSKNS